MEILAMSRAGAIQYCRKKHGHSSVILSVSDPNMEDSTGLFMTPEKLAEAILLLCFCDADRPGTNVYGNETDGSDLMSDDDARKVALFVTGCVTDRGIVHCDAGVSRSGGVAAAIAKWMLNDDSEFFYSGQYRPNMWCYRKTLTALYDSG